MALAQEEYAVVVDSGAGEPLHYTDGCKSAADALERLKAGKDALDAALAAVQSLENDGRFHARGGAVLWSIKFARNPVLVARDVPTQVAEVFQ
jgi:isoaspartyl peptidase/L-asparaginase-like protein (Ntn-hydrolase superfamily)